MNYITPEIFTVGETVVRLNGREYSDVEVIAVDNNEVRVVGAFGRQTTFYVRSDGQYDSQQEEEFVTEFEEEAIPDIIFHKLVLPPAKDTIFTRSLARVAESVDTIINDSFVTRVVKFLS